MKVPPHHRPFLLLLSLVPAGLIGLLFEVFLGHRHDYTGHFLAGYGATLAATAIYFRSMPPIRFADRTASRSIVPCCLVFILAGVITEATLFRIAKFDEIDFYNQSLGAVLAMLCATAIAGPSKPPGSELDQTLFLGVIFLGAGAIYAVA